MHICVCHSPSSPLVLHFIKERGNDPPPGLISLHRPFLPPVLREQTRSPKAQTHTHPKPTQMQLHPRLRSAFASITASQQKDTLDHAINHI